MNVLIVFTDQQHKMALGKRNRLFQTPTLDALADDGVLFTNAYSNNPLCGPYRGCLMTGLLTSHNGVIQNNMPLPEGVPTLAEQLRERGWQTGFVGKWHLGGKGAEPIPISIRGGFERFNAYQMYNGYDPSAPYNNRVAFFDDNNEEHVYDEHRTEVTTKLACNMLYDMSKTGQPFCLVVGYQAPHYPEQPIWEYEKKYRNTVFPLTDEEASTEPYTQTYNPPSPSDLGQCPDYRRYGGNMAEYKRLYAAMVSQVDHGVGELINTLKTLNLYNDTIVIYTSDHGDMQGSHGMKNKDVPYEMSAGVPMIVRSPNGRKGCISDILVCGIDIFATVLDLAGIKDAGDGHSFLDYVNGKSDRKTNEYIISESLHGKSPWQMLRNDQYKLVLSWPEGNPIMLFDMIKDPDERNNLISDHETYRVVIDKLSSVLREQIK